MRPLKHEFRVDVHIFVQIIIKKCKKKGPERSPRESGRYEATRPKGLEGEVVILLASAEEDAAVAHLIPTASVGVDFDLLYITTLIDAPMSN